MIIHYLYIDVIQLHTTRVGLYIHENLRYHFPTCYAYSVKEPIGELNLKRALDEDIYRSLFFLLFPSFILFSTGSDSRFWEFHPSSVILGVFVFFFILIFESLAYSWHGLGESMHIYICSRDGRYI